LDIFIIGIQVMKMHAQKYRNTPIREEPEVNFSPHHRLLEVKILCGEEKSKNERATTSIQYQHPASPEGSPTD
jgi:hypothetical protein